MTKVKESPEAKRDLEATLNDPRKYEGQRLRAELTKQRNNSSRLEVWPWQHPFTHMHASALHEAGHAVIAIALRRQLRKLTVLQDATGAGAVEREVRENTPKEIVEETFIAYAGYEAADLYGLVTDDIHDRKRAQNLNSKRADMVVTSEKAARRSVRKALIGFRHALEDLAVALFSEGELTGEEAADLVEATLSSSKKAIETMNEEIDYLTRKKPVLVLGWGSDGCEDVDEIVNFYGHDQSLYCVRALRADSREVLGEIENWLQGNRDAQILCLGMHGTPSGLRPKRESDSAQITYSELAKAINRNFCGNSSLTVFVGACQSEHAAKVWKKLGPLPVNLLVAFSGKEKIEVIREVLGTFLQQGDLCLPGEIEISKPMEFLERDIEELQRRFASIRIYYKSDGGEQLTKIPEGGTEKLGYDLERRGQVGAGALMEAAIHARKSGAESHLSESAATPKKRSKVGTRTVGRRASTKLRPPKRK
jgi:hypothetical protein